MIIFAGLLGALTMLISVDLFMAMFCVLLGILATINFDSDSALDEVNRKLFRMRK